MNKRIKKKTIYKNILKQVTKFTPISAGGAVIFHLNMDTLWDHEYEAIREVVDALYSHNILGVFVDPHVIDAVNTDKSEIIKYLEDTLSCLKNSKEVL